MPPERRGPTRRRRATAARPAPREAARTPDETRLLRLARELTALGRAPAARGDVVEALLERVGDRAEPPTAGRAAAKTRALALAWAREQARLAVRDLLDRAVAAGQGRADVDRDVLAWLVIAAGEALAGEPAEIVPERLRMLGEFLRPR